MENKWRENVNKDKDTKSKGGLKAFISQRAQPRQQVSAVSEIELVTDRVFWLEIFMRRSICEIRVLATCRFFFSFFIFKSLFFVRANHLAGEDFNTYCLFHKAYTLDKLTLLYTLLNTRTQFLWCFDERRSGRRPFDPMHAAIFSTTPSHVTSYLSRANV